MGSTHSSLEQNNVDIDSSALDLTRELPDGQTAMPRLPVFRSSVDDDRTLEMQFQETLDFIRQLGGNPVATEADLSLSHPSPLLEFQNDNGEVEDVGLDEDDLPYEALLALEEIVGTFRKRLTKETIWAGVGRRQYQPMELASPVEEGCCCICLEGYGDGDVLGKIKCGHEYHYSCIEKWLLRKNTCPLCKLTAVSESGP